MMRIITGSARGTHLETLEGDTTRPTSERLKEALFSMIQFDIEGRRVLDLFGGSGQLGLEALSRGAESATFIDSSREAAEIIQKNARYCKLFDRCRISCMDSVAYLRSSAERAQFDIIFIDPPYASGLIPETLRLIDDGGILAPGGVVVCENGVPDNGKKKRRGGSKPTKEDEAAAVLSQVFADDSDLMSRYFVRRTSTYGAARLTLLEAATDGDTL